MTPGEMADRLEIHEDYHPEEWWSSTFNEEGNCIVCAAAAMLRELAAENERLLAQIDYWKSLHDNERQMRRESNALVRQLRSSADPPQGCTCLFENAMHDSTCAVLK